MCVNYLAVGRQLSFEFFHASPTPLEHGEEWRDEVYQDYLAPFIVHDRHGRRRAVAGNYGFVPQRYCPPGVRLSTMNARAETVAQLRSYKEAWAEGKLCLVPMHAFFEPNWEQGHHVRHRIGMLDESPFAVAGLYRSWHEADGSISRSFTQLTINADDHPLMRRFHKPDDEKRSLVILRPDDYDAWLACKDPALARALLQPYPAELMRAEAVPRTPESPQIALF